MPYILILLKKTILFEYKVKYAIFMKKIKIHLKEVIFTKK